MTETLVHEQIHISCGQPIFHGDTFWTLFHEGWGQADDQTRLVVQIGNMGQPLDFKETEEGTHQWRMSTFIHFLQQGLGIGNTGATDTVNEQNQSYMLYGIHGSLEISYSSSDPQPRTFTINLKGNNSKKGQFLLNHFEATRLLNWLQNGTWTRGPTANAQFCSCTQSGWIGLPGNQQEVQWSFVLNDPSDAPFVLVRIGPYTQVSINFKPGEAKKLADFISNAGSPHVLESFQKNVSDNQYQQSFSLQNGEGSWEISYALNGSPPKSFKIKIAVNQTPISNGPLNHCSFTFPYDSHTSFSDWLRNMP